MVNITSLIKRIIFCFFVVSTTDAATLPRHFAYLQSIAPSIQQDIRYYTDNNFLGRPVKGYDKPVCILTKPTINTLSKVQDELHKNGYSLKVFDCYRPQMAVNDFIRWSRKIKDQAMKTIYYPRVNKADFFKLSYVAARSAHTRGSTVDITLIELSTNNALDMGTRFDFMDKLSHPFSRGVSKRQRSNRMLLRQLMLNNGFKPLKNEWWHFTLRNEPYPNRYFNFRVH